MPRAPIRNTARAVTAPVRDYVNAHFEMVKDEIRRNQPVVDEGAAWERIAELENTVAELSLHQAQLLARVRDEMAAVDDRLARLEHAVERLADVVGAMTEQPTGQRTGT